MRKLVVDFRFWLAVMLAAGAGWLLWPRGDTLTQRFKTAPVHTASITQSVSANGTLNPVVLVNVGTQVSGTVRKLYADFNDRVTQGQILLELDPALLQAQVQQSEAAVRNAQSAFTLAKVNVQRARDLAPKEYVSHQELDSAEQSFASASAQLAQARAQLAKDRTNLAYTTIRSPVAGVVVNRAVDLGQTVAASFQTPTLFQIAQDLSRMQIDSSFAEADVGSVRAGQVAHFSVDAFPSRSFEGIVRQVRLNPTVQQNVVTYDVVIAVDNGEQLLMPGMTAYVNIAIAHHDQALVVPNAALRFKPQDGSAPARAGGHATVYVIAGDKLAAVVVDAGISDGRNTEIAPGALADGDAVVIDDLKAVDTTKAPASNMRVRMF